MAKKSNKHLVIITGIVAALIAASIAIGFFMNKNAGESVRFDHIHGMGYTGDGKSLVVPAHDGLRIYEEGAWKNSDEEPHDYMGFSMTRNGFYSSGHPAQGSNLKNPFGIVKSDNFGSEVKPLILYGEVDFHGMAAGYNTKAIYVMNPQPNSVMETAGLYVSTDEAKSWKNSKAERLTGSASAIAVHPDDENVMALGTDQGAFLSADNGNTFQQISEEPVSALSFTFDEKLLIGSVGEKAALTSFHLTSRESKEAAMASSHEGEAITFIAVNPKDAETMAYSTSENNLYQTRDGGNSWEKLADNGKGATKNAGS